MTIEKEVTIKLTAAEAEKIIKDYLNLKYPDLLIRNAVFNLKTEYGEYGDRGTEVMNEVICTGTIK